MRALIIIPTYNEKDNIIRLINEINGFGITDLDILVIDDNSPDGTSKEVLSIKSSVENLYLIQRAGKLGLGSAYITGFKWALERDYDFVFEMDADFSHDPKDIPRLLQAGIDGAGLAIGSRRIKGGKIIGWSWKRHLSSWGASTLSRLALGLKTKDVTAGFRCFSRETLQKLDFDKISSNGYAFQEEVVFLVEKNNIKISEVPVTFADRKIGQSKLGKKEIIDFFKTIYLLKKRTLLNIKFIKFCLVGGVGMVIDLGALTVMVEWFHWPIMSSNIISFLLAVTNNYILNKIWTFRDTNANIAIQFGKFLIISSVGLLFNIILMKLLLHFGVFYLIAKIIIIGLVVIWNFFANKFWTFKKK